MKLNIIEFIINYFKNAQRRKDGGPIDSILNLPSGKRRPIFQKETWEPTANFFGLPEMGRTFQDTLKYGGGTSSPFGQLAIMIARALGADPKSSYSDQLITSLGLLPGVGKPLGLGAKGLLKTTGKKLEALSLMRSGVHRSYNPNIKTMHPLMAPVESAQVMGPGTYFADDIMYSELYRQYGPHAYKIQAASLMDWIKILKTKGFADYQDLVRSASKYNAGLGPSESANAINLKKILDGAYWDNPAIQGLMREGYIGYRPTSYKGEKKDAFVSWLVGTGRFNLKKLASGGYVNSPKFHNWNGTVPGPYNQEISATLKAGTEGVYQNNYISSLKEKAQGNTYINQPKIEVHAAPGMDEAMLADLVLKKFNQQNDKIAAAQGRSVVR